MERRAFLATSGIGAVTLLTGCLGGDSNSNESGDENGDDDGLETSPNGNDVDSDNGEPAPEPVEADGIVGETIEKDGVAITVEEIARGETATWDGAGKYEALEKQLFIGYEAQVELVGEEPATGVSILRNNPISADYLGQSAGWLLHEEGATVDGNSIPPWEADNGIPEKLYPGESLSGGRIVAVPANEFNAKDLLLTHRLPGDSDVRVRHRGGAGDPSPPYQPSRAEPGTYSFGERVNQSGVEFTVTDYTLSDTIQQQGSTEFPPADTLQFIITTYEAENVSPVARSIPILQVYPELYYDGSRMEGGPGGDNFEAAGEEFTGLYTAAFGNRSQVTEETYPGYSFTGGALVNVVPQQFDASNVEVRMEGRAKNGGDIIFTP